MELYEKSRVLTDHTMLWYIRREDTRSSTITPLWGTKTIGCYHCTFLPLTSITPLWGTKTLLLPFLQEMFLSITPLWGTKTDRRSSTSRCQIPTITPLWGTKTILPFLLWKSKSWLLHPYGGQKLFRWIDFLIRFSIYYTPMGDKNAGRRTATLPYRLLHPYGGQKLCASLRPVR